MSAAKIPHLINMAKAGASNDEIAKRLAISRGSVSGYIHRLRLSGQVIERVRPALPKPVPPRPSSKIKKAMFAGVKPRKEPVIEKVTLEMLGPVNDFPARGLCQFTSDTPNSGDPWRMCGRPQMDGKPYCADHCKVTYIPERPRIR